MSVKNFINPPNIESPNMAKRPGFNDDLSLSSGFDIADLKQYLHIIVKRIWLVALCFVIAVTVAVFIIINQEPLYAATAKVQFGYSSSLPARLASSGGKEGLGKQVEYLAIQESIMRSSKTMQRAYERTGRAYQEIKAAVRVVSVRQLKTLSQLHVSIQSLDPLIGAELANAMSEEFIEVKAEQRLDTSQSTVITLTQQAKRISEQLNVARERLFAFERENSMFVVSGKRNSAVTFLNQLSAKQATYRMERLMLEAQQPYLAEANDDVILTTLANPISGSFLSQDPSADSTQKLTNAGPESLIDRGVVNVSNWEGVKRERATLLAEIAQLKSTFKDAHPKVISAEIKLKQAEQDLDVELQFALQQYYAKLESLVIQENAVNLAAAEWENEAVKLNRKYNDHQLLSEDVNTLSELFKLVSRKLKDVDISIGFEPETVSVLERAAPSDSPINNKNIKNIVLAALLGIGIGIALVFGLEFIDDSIRYPEEVKDVLKLPFFGVIPAANWDPDDLNSHMLSNLDQKSGLTEAYRNVRSALIFSGVVKSGATLAVTSAVPREGKTTTTLNTSVSLSQAGYRVLLVDADMRRGELHKFFGLEGGKGLADVLAGTSKPESLIQRTGIPNLDLIATGPFPASPAELILRDEFKAFTEFAKRTYDITLFDCPPVMAVSESAILASMADSAIFVVWAGQTSRKLSQMSVQTLRERGANIVGCVLNNLEFGRVGYYYYSTYYGYYDYDYRYEATPS